jgi:hypothetical protein
LQCHREKECGRKFSWRKTFFQVFFIGGKHLSCQVKVGMRIAASAYVSR